ncbi:MAG: hypothetical protein JO227_06695 [Acetobacteraceae bacterium]|nr:hypothetical protein [Acetobacteraceae bacterium]
MRASVQSCRDTVHARYIVPQACAQAFKADKDPAGYGYRPERSASDAIQAVLILLRQGHTDVVDADLSKYFDAIPHSALMQSLARRMVDRDMLGLVKQWLKAPVATTGGQAAHGRRQGQHPRTPQRGVISPLVANLYMNRFLKHWRRSGSGRLRHSQRAATRRRPWPGRIA